MGKNTQIRIFESNNSSAIFQQLISSICQLSGDSNVNAKESRRKVLIIFIGFLVLPDLFKRSHVSRRELKILIRNSESTIN
jgi:hypothetical protein